VVHVEQLLNAAHALSGVLLQRFEADGRWAADGSLSAAAWTASRTGSARAGLRSRRRQGAALAALPKVAQEARDGRLSTEHLRAVGDCAHGHLELAVEHEALWVEQAEALSAERFRVARRPPAMQPRTESHSAPKVRSSTWAARPTGGRPPSAARSPSATAAAVFPDCDRPPSWCDVHHCTPWADDGGTSVDNGALLCRRHHTFIHRQRWQITIDNGRPTTRRPDGTTHTTRRWQHPDARAS
jgi:hypothetical protein